MLCGNVISSDIHRLFFLISSGPCVPFICTVSDLEMELPEADLYHCVATGYAGVIGSMAKKRYGCGLMVSEHGIYTREREEELIRAKWVGGIYKKYLDRTV